MGEIYKQTIANLQPSNRLPLKNNTDKSDKITAPLIDSEEILVDHEDWLEDDIGINLNKRKKPYFDGVQSKIVNENDYFVKRKSMTNSDYEISTEKNMKRQKVSNENKSPVTIVDSDSNSSNTSETIIEDLSGSEVWPKTNKKRQVSLFKKGFTKTNLSSKSPSPIKLDKSPSPESLISSPILSENKRRSWESTTNETLDLNITLEDEIFELKLHSRDLRKTINDIEELIRHKFEAKTGCRPEIIFKTIDNVVLSANISFYDIPKNNSKLLLKGEITHMNLSPIVERYKKICATYNVDVTDSMIKSLKSCDNTSIFRLNNADLIINKELLSLVKCLRYQINLQSLDLSGISFFKKGDLLNQMIEKLDGLYELHLQCCDVNYECLEQIQKLPSELRILDLSYNPLKNKSQKKLFELIKPLLRLQTLNLKSCELHEYKYKYINDSLINLDISHNPIGGEGVANILQLQLLNLRMSNTLSRLNHINVIDKIFFDDSEYFSFNALECLELGSCQVTDFDVEKILSKTPNITKIVLNNNINVTKTSLCAILMRKPTLRYIDLSGCKLIEETPPIDLQIVTPQVCTLLVNMKSSVVDEWKMLWQDMGKVKKFPDSLVIFKPL